jgi:hypothetical protein
VHGHRDAVVVEYHSFSDDTEDAAATGRAWQDWLGRVFNLTRPCDGA